MRAYLSPYSMIIRKFGNSRKPRSSFASRTEENHRISILIMGGTSSDYHLIGAPSDQITTWRANDGAERRGRSNNKPPLSLLVLKISSLVCSSQSLDCSKFKLRRDFN